VHEAGGRGDGHMSPRSKAQALACRLGATIETMQIYDGGVDIQALAPPLKQWRSSGSHTLVAISRTKEGRKYAWADLADRMGDGLMCCPLSCGCRTEMLP
jgi:hypothetical protein